jgi:hypothetical protein
MSRSSSMLASVYDVPLADRKSVPLAGLMDAAARHAAAKPVHKPNTEPRESRRRNRIWELNTSLHCSIKRVCRQAARPYRPLRTSSLACLLSALATLRATSC